MKRAEFMKSIYAEEVSLRHQVDSLVEQRNVLRSSVASLEEQNKQLHHDLNNAKCAAKMAMKLVGRCKVCNNRTQVLGETNEIERLLE